ncbi:MAG: type II toxin-antitoxin system HicB family antitoxin [Oscillatoriales cyanobacterium]|nr:MULTISPECIES: type II toxin-antitoxin system HicB family antitoxin [unclassified Microcoleus]MCC3502393.1 type II toxin-antitoxin system HicB family antitoxin [Microcoleus sp. PH2017_19_SFW_U_A]TAD81429.1 MAG: type II toxin-antitoxin system HicB family antitoxin [Oscillatoriales cyanobacterium]MCC3521176.1 type II toxin-antitoxin system HicB family antitoxin [Microcoleus sp. PH2017_20_SFW_D_A]MCC3552194.1 type II toxin-antitoxin system HicB family antitoxin [Microcoleus sp. PH2017_35_SFW_U_B
MRYAVAIQKSESNYSAFVPDLPGCVAIGATIEEVEQQIKAAIVFYLEDLRQSGSSIPEARTLCKYVEV